MNENIYLLNRRANYRLVVEVSDIAKTLDPITGYAQEPLLPLVDACAPLRSIINNILEHVSIALEYTPENPADGLTRDESASIRLYTMEWTGENSNFYCILNQTLNMSDRQNLKPWFKYLKLFLTALAKMPCVTPQTVWRGVKKHVRDDFPRGTEVIWWGFSSCTVSLPVLENDLYLGSTGKRTLFSVEVINARNVRAHSNFANEDEVLLLPGTYMEVQSKFNPAPELHIVHLKQKIPDEMLLESPFEGACLYPKTDTSSRRRWHRKKRFFIPLSSLTVMLVVGTILGAVLGTRSTTNMNNGTKASNRSIIRGTAFGGNGGNIFNDSRDLELKVSDDVLIGINASWDLDKLHDITVIYSTGKTQKHGGDNVYQPATFFGSLLLNKTETITGVTVYTGLRIIPNFTNPNGTLIVVGLQLYTNTNRQSSIFGSSDGTVFNEAFANYTMFYVLGRSGGNIDQIQFVWYQ